MFAFGLSMTLDSHLDSYLLNTRRYAGAAKLPADCDFIEYSGKFVPTVHGPIDRSWSHLPI